MLIVNQKGNKRVNYNNVENIEIITINNEKNPFAIVAHLVSGNVVGLGSFTSAEKASQAIANLDEAILETERYKHLNLSREMELESIYKDMYIFYMNDCEV